MMYLGYIWFKGNEFIYHPANQYRKARFRKAAMRQLKRSVSASDVTWNAMIILRR